MSAAKEPQAPATPPADTEKRPVRVFLGNRSARNVTAFAADKGLDIHNDANDPRVLAEGAGLSDPESGLVHLSCPIEGKRATIVEIPAGTPLSNAFTTITAPGQGVWHNQIHDKEAKPAWVASDWPGLATLLADNYGCPIREIDENEVEKSFGALHTRGEV
jgi:hypothetical protein